MSAAEIEELVENNNYGSVNLNDVNIPESDVLKRLLKGKYDPSKSYNVLFFFTRKGKTVATETKSGKTSVLKADARNAAKRTAVNKMIKVMQKPLAGLLKSQGKDGLADELSTPEGKALLAGVLGTLQLMLPQLQSDEAALIGEELRTQALSYVTDHIGDLLDPLIEVFSEAAASLPKMLP